jgi:hypothetical protein
MNEHVLRGPGPRTPVNQKSTNTSRGTYQLVGRLLVLLIPCVPFIALHPIQWVHVDHVEPENRLIGGGGGGLDRSY